jgi:hypothetical protein
LKRFAVFLLVWAAAFALLYRLTWNRYYPPGEWIGALIVSFFVALGVGALRRSRMAHGDELIVARAEASLSDGTRVAIAGTIEPVAAALEAPFSGDPCVAYEYEIYHVEYGNTSSTRSTRTEVVDRSGFALAPCVIRSGGRDVALHAYPGLERFSRTAHDPASGRTYLAGTQFEDRTGLGIFKAASEITGLFHDHNGAVRKDLQLSSRENLDGSSAREEIVPPGAAVCVIGRYSAAENAIIPEEGTAGVRLIRGTRDEALEHVHDGRLSSLIAAVFFLVVPFLAGWGVLHLREKDLDAKGRNSVRIDRAEALLDAVKYGRTDDVRRLLARGADARASDDYGVPLLSWARNAAIAKMLFDAGAKVDAVSRDGLTPLMYAKRDGREDVAAFLIAHGARK